MVQTPTDLNFEHQEVIDWLIGNNYPALPVAPAQPAEKYPLLNKATGQPELDKDGNPKPRFTGKNPSYLDRDGIPHLVNHRQYQNRLPSDHDLKAWFANPLNGIGTLGGWNETVWLDFDVKQFLSQEECDSAVLKILERPELQQTFIERTAGSSVRLNFDKLSCRAHAEVSASRSHSGGWRIGIKVKQKPSFTNFALEPGGKHVGEALGEGRFTVLAPTIGPSGKAYESLNRTQPILIESLESIGIYATKVKAVEFYSLNRAPGIISLEALGSETATVVLNGSDKKGDRSDSLTTALKEWYGWQNWARDNGIAIVGSPEELAHHAGSQLGIDSDRINRIIKSVSDETGTATPAALRHGEDSCWKKIFRLDRPSFESKCPVDIKNAIYQEWNLKAQTQSAQSQNNVVPLPIALQPLDISKVSAEIRKILIKEPAPAELQAAKIELRVKYPRLSERELNLLFETLGKQIQLEECRGDNRLELEALLKHNTNSLDISDFLPPDLANPLKLWCGWMQIKEEVALTSVLTAVSSLHTVGTELCIHRSQEFYVPPTIYGAIVSESGQKKSPIFSTLVKRPLRLLHDQARLEHQLQMQTYERESREYNKNPEGSPPKKPGQKVYFFTDATHEGIRATASNCPEKSLFALIDELAGLFNSDNKYRNGKGSDRQDTLSYFDGTGAVALRSDGIKADVMRIYLSIFGTIQPQVLSNFMRDCQDPDGHWARFLFVHQPLKAATLSDDEGGFSIVDLLTNYYRKIDAIPLKQYRLSREAFKRYQQVYDKLEKLRVTHSNAGMRAVYSKMEGYIGRLATNLHVIWEISQGKDMPNDEIPLAILEMAIALAKFYIGQIQLTHANANAKDPDNLAPHIAKLMELSQRLEANGQDGWIKAKPYQNCFSSLERPTADVARSWMKEATAMGFGQTRNQGIYLEYHWRSLISDDDIDPNPPGLLSPPTDHLNPQNLKASKSSTIVDAESIDTPSFVAVLEPESQKLVPPTEIELPTPIDEVTNNSQSHGLSINQYCAVSKITTSLLQQAVAEDENSDNWMQNESNIDISINPASTNLEQMDANGCCGFKQDSTSTATNCLVSRLPHCQTLPQFKAITRGMLLETIETALRLVQASEEQSARLQRFWLRIRSRFVLE